MEVIAMGQQVQDYATMSKDELAQEMGRSFGEARKYIEQGQPVPKDIWQNVSQTVAGLCERVGIDTPDTLIGFPSGS